MEILETRHQLRARVKGCEACELHVNGNGPVPFRGPTPARVTVLGQAPGRVESEVGRPFSGPSGALLTELMAKVGLDNKEMLFCNPVSCWPRNPAGGGDLEPTVAQMVACGRHRNEQLALGQSPYLLLVGKVALKTLRPDLEIGHMHGRPMYWGKGHILATPGHDQIQWWADPLVAWSIYHPAAGLRHPKYKKMILDDLVELRKLMDVGYEGYEWPETCHRCAAEVEEWDENGVGTCSDHLGKQGGLF